MSSDLLFRSFERVTAADDSSSRLRQFVLGLAVRGMLTGREPSDVPATTLLAEIERAQKEFRQTGRRKRTVFEPVAGNEEPFQLPETWCWTRLRQITRDHGQTIPDSEFTYIDVSSIDKEGGSIRNPTVLSADIAPSRARKVVCKGDVLYSCVRPYLLNVAIVDVEFDPSPIASTAFAVLDGMGFVEARYLWTVLRSPYFIQCVQRAMRGQAYPAINDAALAQVPVPLPPSAEQLRIVSKVNELISLCNEMEAAQLEEYLQRDKLRGASLQSLIGQSGEPQNPDAEIFFKEYQRLITRPEHLVDVRRTVLDLAVRGQLACRDTSDEPVEASLAASDSVRIETADVDRRASSSQQELLNANLRWHVPSNWAWRGLADLVLFIDYRGKTPSKTEVGIRLITAKNVRQGSISLNPEEFVSDAVYDKWMTRGIPEYGDVLFTTEAPMGNAAAVRLNEPFALAQRVIDFRSYGSLDPDFLVLQLSSPPFQALLDHTATGLTAKGIKAAKLKRLPIAVPPLEEQRRIVSRAEALMTTCDHLEAALAGAQTERNRLLDALLGEVERD